MNAPHPLTVAGSALQVRAGGASAQGPRERNEDYYGFVEPPAALLASKGVVLAVADGVSGSAGGAEAAEHAVRNLLADYYSTPETWGIPQALERVVAAMNRWLLAQSMARDEHRGMATTLTALVLRGGRWCLGHVGDSRLYRLRDGVLSQLTHDHVWDRPGLTHVLTRALGMDAHLVMDYAEGELARGDVFLLCSDGVWEPLGERRIAALLGAADPQAAADELVRAALAGGGRDNATALVAHVDAEGGGLRELLGEGRRLPLPGRLRPGAWIDGFRVLDCVHESRATLLYRVEDADSGRQFALKTLQPALAQDSTSCDGLLTEEWLAKRLVAPCFAQVLPLAPGRRNFLYYVASFHAGATLQAHLDQGRHFTVDEVLALGAQLLRGAGALHRLRVLHRDIKPANLLWCADGSLRILDLGVALAAGVPYPELAGNPGTPSYMAPELFDGAPATAGTDLYAVGVTLYQLLTRRYPYGEVEPFQHPRFGEPRRPTRYRPDVPGWLENLLLRAVARDARLRFETAEEMLLALQRAGSAPLAAPPPLPLLRDPLRRWRALALASLLVNLILGWLLLH